jgi:hypothetical protein
VVLAQRLELDVDLAVQRLDVRARQAGDEDEVVGDAQVLRDVVDRMSTPFLRSARAATAAAISRGVMGWLLWGKAGF